MTTSDETLNILEQIAVELSYVDKIDSYKFQFGNLIGVDEKGDNILSVNFMSKKIELMKPNPVHVLTRVPFTLLANDVYGNTKVLIDQLYTVA